MKTDTLILFSCDACGYRARVPRSYDGTAILCPSCKIPKMASSGGDQRPRTGQTQVITMPTPAPGATPPPIAATAPAQSAGDKIDFACSKCGCRARINAAYAGKVVRCPQCEAVQIAMMGAAIATNQFSKGVKPAPPSPRHATLDSGGRIVFTCSTCGFSAKLAPSYAGKAIQCPSCRSPQVVDHLPSGDAPIAAAADGPVTSSTTRVSAKPGLPAAAPATTPRPGLEIDLDLDDAPTAKPASRPALPMAPAKMPTPRPAATPTPTPVAKMATPLPVASAAGAAGGGPAAGGAKPKGNPAGAPAGGKPASGPPAEEGEDAGDLFATTPAETRPPSSGRVVRRGPKTESSATIRHNTPRPADQAPAPPASSARSTPVPVAASAPPSPARATAPGPGAADRPAAAPRSRSGAIIGLGALALVALIATGYFALQWNTTSETLVSKEGALSAAQADVRRKQTEIDAAKAALGTAEAELIRLTEQIASEKEATRKVESDLAAERTAHQRAKDDLDAERIKREAAEKARDATMQNKPAPAR